MVADDATFAQELDVRDLDAEVDADDDNNQPRRLDRYHGCTGAEGVNRR